jgi:energy-coupling factor transport system substrate-specific component
MDGKKPNLIIKDFNTLALLLIPIGISINYAGGLIVKTLQLPLFLDTIGTLIVAVIAGPWVGGLTGLLNNIIFGLTINPVSIPYGIVNLAIGLGAGFMAHAGWFEKPERVFFAGLVVVALAVGFSVPINVLLFGGAAHGSAGIISGYLIAIGTGLWKTVFAVSIFRELGDKLLSVFVVYGIYKLLPVSYLTKFPGYTRRHVKPK